MSSCDGIVVDVGGRFLFFADSSKDLIPDLGLHEIHRTVLLAKLETTESEGRKEDTYTASWGWLVGLTKSILSSTSARKSTTDDVMATDTKGNLVPDAFTNRLQIASFGNRVGTGWGLYPNDGSITILKSVVCCLVNSRASSSQSFRGLYGKYRNFLFFSL